MIKIMPDSQKVLPYSCVDKNYQAGAVNPLIIVAVLAIVGIGGYFLFSQKGSLPTPSISSGPSVFQRATEKDFDFIDDPTLKKHFVAQANQTTYRTKGTSPGSGLTTVSEVQIKGADFNTRQIDSNVDKEIKHMITIGDTNYLKDYSDSKWWKQTIKPEALSEDEDKEEPVDFKEEYSQPNLQYKALGKEACGPPAGGLTCFKYEQIMPENPEVKRIFWFDDKDHLLRKEQAGFGEFIATVEYTYDGINITAPSPTKDVPEGKNIYDYLNANYTQPTPQLPQTSEYNQEEINQQVEETEY